MTKYKVRSSGQSVDLNQSNFKAKGGEGSVYIIGHTVYKICEDGKMIPEEKFQELNLLDHPKIVRPIDVILDSKKKAVGYTMDLVPGNSMTLTRILSKTFRERENVTPDMMSNLVQQMADGLRFIHKKPGYLQVDGNENNYMVTSDFKDLYFIDVNSFQTPKFPATAIMASIRDYHCKQNNGIYLWDHNTDWYSFAVISFYMFTAIHPFKGSHPAFPNLKTAMIDQMKGCKSVLDPEVTFPKAAVYFPFENVIPGGDSGAFMQWYRAIFIDNKRCPPPDSFQAKINFVIKVKEIVGSNCFDIKEVRDFLDKIVGFYPGSMSRNVFVTSNNVYINNQTRLKPANKFRVGFTPKNSTPVAAWLDGDDLVLKDLNSDQIIPCNIKGKDLTSYQGRIYVQSSKDIIEIQFIETGSSNIAVSKSVASIMPYATEMFQGVAFQDMFGTKMVSVFPESGYHRQIKIEELNDFQISDAKFENNVLMVIARSKKNGEYTRFIFRFARQWDKYDLRLVENINPNGLNFTVIDKGICVCLTEEEKIEIFSAECNNPGVKTFTDPAIKADMQLCHEDNQVYFAHHSKLYSFSVKK